MSTFLLALAVLGLVCALIVWPLLHPTAALTKGAMESASSPLADARAETTHERRTQLLEALGELTVAYHSRKVSATDYQGERSRLERLYAELEG